MSWIDFRDPMFIPIFTPTFTDPDLEAQAMVLCNDDPACLFDVAATGRLDIGFATRSGSEQLAIIASLTTPGKQILSVIYYTILVFCAHMHAFNIICIL